MRIMNLKIPSSVQKEDLLGNKEPSFFFYPLVYMLSYLLLCDPRKILSKLNIGIRKVLHPILMLLVPLFMDYKQKMENKNSLLGIDSPDVPLEVPKEPVIWCVNHGFKDDIAASIHSTRHSYMFFGSLPHFFNTFDGVALFLNGVILCNRKNRQMKKAAFDLAIQCIKQGNDLTIFPEGVWNKTPEKLILDLWPGIYRMASETGAKVIPVIHYLADPHKRYDGNVIHTVIADPIRMNGISEQEGLEMIRDTMATWYFLLMEKYGQTTRAELMDGFEDADDAWKSYMAMHTSFQKYYDLEIERCADYRPKQIVRPEDVWQSVANIENVHAGNIHHVIFAQELIAREQRRNFQRRF